MELKAAACDTCLRTEQYTTGSKPEQWWLVFGPPGTPMRHFCCPGCLARYFAPVIVADGPVTVASEGVYSIERSIE